MLALTNSNKRSSRSSSVNATDSNPQTTNSTAPTANVHHVSPVNNGHAEKTTSKVENSTTNVQEVNGSPPTSGTGDGTIIHICHWHGDCVVNVHPQGSLQPSLLALASSIQHQSQQHRH